nr:hypothetical protein [Tanacetum cinerariifolium]
VLAEGIDVPTSSGSIPTAGPPTTIISTGSEKQKSSEEAPEIETSTEEFTEEKMKKMMQLVPVEDVYNFMHAPVEWKLYDLSGVHYVTAKRQRDLHASKKDYPLRKGLALVMISYKLQVENYSQMAEDLIRKIYNIANSPRRKEMPLPEVCTTIEEKKKKLPYSRLVRTYTFQDLLQAVVVSALALIDFHELVLAGDLSSIGVNGADVDGIFVWRERGQGCHNLTPFVVEERGLKCY